MITFSDFAKVERCPGSKGFISPVFFLSRLEFNKYKNRLGLVVNRQKNNQEK